MEKEAENFYQDSLRLLRRADIPFLVGGAYAFCFYTGIVRETKDLDLFIRPRDLDAVLNAFRAARYRAEQTFPHWLGKVFAGENCIDIVYRAGNGLCEIDDSWFARARPAEVLNMAVNICAPEEIIWMKAYIMERERYDGADVAHLFEACAEKLDWQHLLRRFGPDWRVLLSHLILFGFVYPSEKKRVPSFVMETLLGQLRADEIVAVSDRVCRGTLLSRAQYLPDIETRGYIDARLNPRSQITKQEIVSWTNAIEEQVKARDAEVTGESQSDAAER